MLLVRMVLLTLFTAAGACSVTTVDLDTTGTVRFVDVEGGCWAIDTAEQRYEPIDLPEAFRRDGLEVSFKANRIDRMSICQIGPTIEVESIDSIG